MKHLRVDRCVAYAENLIHICQRMSVIELQEAISKLRAGACLSTHHSIIAVLQDYVKGKKLHNSFIRSKQ